MVSQILDANLQDMKCNVIKTGMLRWMQSKKFLLADILTPNISDCFKLLGENREVSKLQDGGHIPCDDGKEKHITDVPYLGAEQKFITFKGQLVNTLLTYHGAGCTLASAIASNLARGYSLPNLFMVVLSMYRMPSQLAVTLPRKL
ncbi:CGH_1_collapsed_G0015400.mRNA.1.CDS.1 [Saccharomyces cerevisiae]|nr:CGH_1_collapsed_G0015400.mRNA.1.CDS.1 [Saccharomyces cerevisiae]